ncbi:alpha/beta hydrolase [Sphingomonas sp. Leaf339]|uniref:alpha/beta fold hydrolase n=1 Tax=Sphingomonas sp. Leaf339 TaxID=1736343 RepID=UPI0006FA2B3E|nr:alpha/beta hydrolase [Sphingomonas sp. Leaf339]KQU55868.1 alpha/beta hydrolase [Sphingomonas sp. Leaf339]
MAAYANIHWWSNDGIRLHARDYPGDPTKLPLICLPGLTRNARDFAAFAEARSGDRRVIAVDFRGRGESGYAKDPMTYVPLTYVQDVEALLIDQGIGRFVAVGTSLGGIVTMLLAGPARGRLAGALLNDIGPEIESAGLHRIRGYVGKGSSCPTWLHAARTVQENNADIYPEWELDQWLGMAKRLYRLTGNGRIVLDYDLRIAEPMRVPGAETGPDMWGALAGLVDIPVLLVRGEGSDLLGAATAVRMAAALPQSDLAVVPGVGHAPMLDEPVAAAAIDRWLARLD